MDAAARLLGLGLGPVFLPPRRGRPREGNGPRGPQASVGAGEPTWGRRDTVGTQSGPRLGTAASPLLQPADQRRAGPRRQGRFSQPPGEGRCTRAPPSRQTKEQTNGLDPTRAPPSRLISSRRHTGNPKARQRVDPTGACSFCVESALSAQLLCAARGRHGTPRAAGWPLACPSTLEQQLAWPHGWQV